MRICCIGYIINLIVQAFLFAGVITAQELKSYNKQEQTGQLLNNKAKKVQFRLLGPLGKAYNIVVYICALPS
jgi:hypothetical protein